MTEPKQKILEKIGSGTYSDIYKVLNMDTNTMCAMKSIKHQFAGYKVFHSIFRWNIEVSKQVSHPNVIKNHYFVHEDANRFFMVMDYVDGFNLYELCTLLPALPHSLKFYILQEVLKGINACHEVHIVHRNLNSSNILVSRNGGVHFGNFGLSASEKPDPGNLHLAERNISFLAPEQIHQIDVTAHADIWAFGIMMHELLLDHNPFTSNNPNLSVTRICDEQLIIPPEVDPGIAVIIERCLRKDPEQRYPTILLILEKIQDMLQASGLSEQDCKEELATSLGELSEELSPDNVSVDRMIMEMDSEEIPVFSDTLTKFHDPDGTEKPSAETSTGISNGQSEESEEELVTEKDIFGESPDVPLPEKSEPDESLEIKPEPPPLPVEDETRQPDKEISLSDDENIDFSAVSDLPSPDDHEPDETGIESLLSPDNSPETNNDKMILERDEFEDIPDDEDLQIPDPDSTTQIEPSSEVISEYPGAHDENFQPDSMDTDDLLSDLTLPGTDEDISDLLKPDYPAAPQDFEPGITDEKLHDVEDKSDELFDVETDLETSSDPQETGTDGQENLSELLDDLSKPDTYSGMEDDQPVSSVPLTDIKPDVSEEEINDKQEDFNDESGETNDMESDTEELSSVYDRSGELKIPEVENDDKETDEDSIPEDKHRLSAFEQALESAEGDISKEPEEPEDPEVQDTEESVTDQSEPEYVEEIPRNHLQRKKSEKKLFLLVILLASVLFLLLIIGDFFNWARWPVNIIRKQSTHITQPFNVSNTPSPAATASVNVLDHFPKIPGDLRLSPTPGSSKPQLSVPPTLMPVDTPTASITRPPEPTATEKPRLEIPEKIVSTLLTGDLLTASALLKKESKTNPGNRPKINQYLERVGSLQRSCRNAKDYLINPKRYSSALQQFSIIENAYYSLLKDMNQPINKSLKLIIDGLDIDAERMRIGDAVIFLILPQNQDLSKIYVNGDPLQYSLVENGYITSTIVARSPACQLLTSNKDGKITKTILKTDTLRKMDRKGLWVINNHKNKVIFTIKGKSQSLKPDQRVFIPNTGKLAIACGSWGKFKFDSSVLKNKKQPVTRIHIVYIEQ